MRMTAAYYHCGNEGSCVSEHHECECGCQHCKQSKTHRQFLLNEAERNIHSSHREETETCPPCLSFQDARKARRRAKEARRDRKDRKSGRKAAEVA